MLWRGMLPALYRHAIYTGTRMTAYEEIRSSVTRDNKDGFPMWKKVLVGMSAGGFGQFVASPTDLVKTQIQVGKRNLAPVYLAEVDDLFSNTCSKGNYLLCHLLDGGPSAPSGRTPSRQRLAGRLQEDRGGGRRPGPLARLLAQRAARRPRQPGRPHHLRLHQGEDTRAHHHRGQLAGALPRVGMRGVRRSLKGFDIFLKRFFSVWWAPSWAPPPTWSRPG